MIHSKIFTPNSNRAWALFENPPTHVKSVVWPRTTLSFPLYVSVNNQSVICRETGAMPSPTSPSLERNWWGFCLAWLAWGSEPCTSPRASDSASGRWAWRRPVTRGRVVLPTRLSAAPALPSTLGTPVRWAASSPTDVAQYRQCVFL